MKRLLLCFLVALLVCPVFSQNTLTIHQKDGQQFSFGLEDQGLYIINTENLTCKILKK